MANGVAPVCRTVRDQAEPRLKRQLIPTIRRGDVNQIVDVVNTLTNNPNQPEWEEEERNTQRVRIHNPEDYNQWVEVERITKVVLKNTLTGAKFEWVYRPR